MTIESTLERIATALETLAAAPKTETTDAPKTTRRRATAAGASTAASDKESATDAAAASSAETQTTAPASAVADKETDDLFGEEPAKEEKVKEVTIDDVRAKLVEVQTKFKHKDHALACLKHVSGGMVLSGLKKEDHAKLVDVCTKALAKDTPPKF